MTHDPIGCHASPSVHVKLFSLVSPCKSLVFMLVTQYPSARVHVYVVHQNVPGPQPLLYLYTNAILAGIEEVVPSEKHYLVIRLHEARHAELAILFTCMPTCTQQVVTCMVCAVLLHHAWRRPWAREHKHATTACYTSIGKVHAV